MKHQRKQLRNLLLLLPLCLLMQCITEQPEPEELPLCVDETSEDVLGERQSSTGTVRKITLWVPEVPFATSEEIRDGTVAMTQVELWVIISFDNPQEIVYACNLPEDFKNHGIDVLYRGKELCKTTQLPYPIEGMTIVSLTRISIDTTEED